MEIEKLFEDLTPEKARILRNQIERFDMYKNQDIIGVDIEKEIVLPEGTLIHGTSCMPKTLTSISETGIITGQAFGIPEDGETFFCADFHRVDKIQTMEEYNKEFSYGDGRCPFGNKGKRKVAFIIYPNEKLKEITDYDCYRDDTQASLDTKGFVNMAGLPINDKNKASSVLFGVPKCFISGIVLGDECINEEFVDYIIKRFPGAFITRNNGELLYKKGDTKEMMDLRLQKVMASIQNERSLKMIKMLTTDLERTRTEQNNLWDAIATLPVESIAGIYDFLGYQGDTLAQAENFKARKQK